MQYSKLSPLKQVRRTVSTFLGYDHHPRIREGAFYDMHNLSDRCYPLLAPRAPRGFITGGEDIRCLLAKEQLCYVDGPWVVIGDERFDLGLSGPDTTMVSMGAYIILLPDKKYINTANTDDRGSLEAFYTGGPFQACLCSAGGEPLVLASSDENPQEGIYRVRDGALWIYSAARWVSVSATYINISAPGIHLPFQQGDGVGIGGCDALPSSAVIQCLGEDFLVIQGFLSEPVSGDSLSVSREMPAMDFVIEAGNRLWGCRYGPDSQGNPVNELYASKLGDFKNWNVFQGISTDSYAVSLGSDGPFTGAVRYLGEPIFFKEEQLHRVRGSEPASFSVQSEGCQGVQRGSHKSLALVGETLLYKSRLGVCAYQGALPVSVSQALGDGSYRDAVAGGHGSKYYISMADEQGVYHLFVYNTQRSLWHREDNTRADCFASFGSDLFYLDHSDGQIKTILGTQGANLFGPVEWSAETGLIGLEDPDQKRLQSIQVRLQLAMDSRAEIDVEYDSSGVWEFACALGNRGTGSYCMPVKPRSCDHLRLRLRGRGEMRLLGITRVMGK